MAMHYKDFPTLYCSEKQVKFNPEIRHSITNPDQYDHEASRQARFHSQADERKLSGHVGNHIGIGVNAPATRIAICAMDQGPCQAECCCCSPSLSPSLSLSLFISLSLSFSLPLILSRSLSLPFSLSVSCSLILSLSLSLVLSFSLSRFSSLSFSPSLVFSLSLSRSLWIALSLSLCLFPPPLSFSLSHSYPVSPFLSLYHSIWKVASWYIPLSTGIYHRSNDMYHMVYTIWYIPH